MMIRQFIGCACLAVALLLGFCLFASVKAEAQVIVPEEKLFSKEFNIDKWKVQGYRTLTVYFGDRTFSWKGKFTYKGTEYTIHWFRVSNKHAEVNISPKFPPELADKSKFAFHLGSKGRTPDRFKFNSASVNGNTSKWWATNNNIRAGYIENDDVTKNGVIQITRVDDETGKHVRFTKQRPDPGLDSQGRPFSGRIEVYDPKDSDTVYRVCDRGFDEKDAQVACRTMGLPSLGAKPLDLSKTDWLATKLTGWAAGWDVVGFVLGLGSIPALFDKLECTGNEGNFLKCKHLGRGVVAGSVCPITNTAAVTCPFADDSDRNAQTDTECLCGKHNQPEAYKGLCWTRNQCRILYPNRGY